MVDLLVCSFRHALLVRVCHCVELTTVAANVVTMHRV